ncbi:MAG: Lon protease family protein [Planctomycetota bacterium]|jgi:ATP-dependent Lon protease
MGDVPASGTVPSEAPAPLAAGDVRWICPTDLPFDTTEQVEPARDVVGQDAAVEALRFGLEHYAPGQNIFVRGLTGTGRMTLIRQLLEHIHPTCPLAPDRCYVHNFQQRDRPRLISLPRGRGRFFVRRVDELIDYITDELEQALASDAMKSRQSALERVGQQRAKSVIEPFERELAEADLAFVSLQSGPVMQGALFPLVDGKPVPPEEFEQLHAEQRISDEQHARFHEQHEKFSDRLREVMQELVSGRMEAAERMRKSFRLETRALLENFTSRMKVEFPDERVASFLDDLVQDMVDNRLPQLAKDDSFTRVYRVNLLHENREADTCPIVVETSPTMMNLLGTIDIDLDPTSGTAAVDHLQVHAGSLLRADGGYLILDARDVLSEPGAWKMLVRTLRNHRLEIVPPELAFPWSRHALKPEAIDLNVKVILLGDVEIYALLDQLDPDFPNLFKVLADFDSVIPRDDQGVAKYASVIARFTRDGDLPPFEAGAVAALVEHGARIASRRGKLTARFSRLADIAREAAFVARKDGRSRVTADDVKHTVTRTKRRADLPSRRFREYLADGTILVETSGRTAGQINGLAVLAAGQLTYGFPARITATIGAGSAGVVNIEREANLSGAIHTKGFYILGGLLRSLLQTDHPLAFSASIAFEQSYGGIDGDSASGAEICCLLSALTGIPIRQDLAMTGAIDQRGRVLAIGAVNEKIEGFFETCRDIGFTGTQGVIIPRSNAGDLMLRDDVVAEVAAGRFQVYAVENVHQALEILTDVPAGRRDGDGQYPPGTVLARAVDKADAFWERAAAATRGPGPIPGAPAAAPDA